MNNLYNTIAELDNAAAVPAFRTLTHSAMARTIGYIRQDIRERERMSRDEEQVSLDQRNEQDDQRGVKDTDQIFGFDGRQAPLRMAAMMHSIYSVCDSATRTKAQSAFDRPMDLDQMLDFMTEQARSLPQEIVEILATAAKTSPEAIRKMHEMQELQEREQMRKHRPEIEATFNGLPEAGYYEEEAFDQLDPVDHHQLGVKTIEGLNKAKDRVLMSIMRTQRLSELSQIPVIDAAIETLTKWVQAWEERYTREIGEAIENGRTIHTLST